VPQSPTEIPSELPCLLPTEYPSVITVEFYRRKYSVGNLVAGIFFLARWSVCNSVGIVFFITDRNGDGIRITDAHDSDGINLSKIPSVIILPTVCVPYTDGINPSVKLYNGVVIKLENIIFYKLKLNDKTENK
jgi:hypothetical protein